MKIILSHDVDHLYWKQHYFRSIFAQKHVFRHSMALLQNKIDFKIWISRMKIWGRIHRIPELLNFYEENKIKANFFFGMDNVLGLTYYPSEAEPWIKRIIESGHEVGVHGIAYADKVQIQNEYDTFQKISSLQTFGIRNHYLRMNGYTLEMLSEQQYLYDSTIQGILHPFKIGDMWEIPMSIMDSSLIPYSQSNMNLQLWKEATLHKLKQAEEIKIPYFVVNLHDPYFDEDQFPHSFEWFHWFIQECQSGNLEFITFKQAIRELNSGYLG